MKKKMRINKLSVPKMITTGLPIYCHFASFDKRLVRLFSCFSINKALRFENALALCRGFFSGKFHKNLREGQHHHVQHTHQANQFVA